jgi:hypothetical protein
MASWVPIFVVTPYEQMWHISGSLDRLLLQVYPLALAGVVLDLALRWRESPPLGAGR